MNTNETDFGKCCGCETVHYVRNIVLHHLRLPDGNLTNDGYGAWGCFVCNLPSEGAISVLCDDCLEYNNIRWFVIGDPSLNNRGLMKILNQTFEHDFSLHRERHEEN